MLGLERLELRRLRSDLIFCFKIINGFTCLVPDEFFTLLDIPYNTRGHDFKLSVPVSRIDCRLNFFGVRIIKAWNSLPNELVNSKSVNLFTNNLKRVDLNAFISGKP